MITIGKKSKVGTTKGRIDWNLAENISFIGFVESGLHANVIGEKCGGMTEQQVYNRCRILGRSVREYRDGKTEMAKVVIKAYSVETISKATSEELIRKLHKMI